MNSLSSNSRNNAHCRLSHAFKDTHVYAMNNKMALSTHHDQTYLIAHVSENTNEIIFDPKTEIVVQDQETQALYGEHGIHLHTRSEIQNGDVKMGQKRLIAVGGILALQDESGASAIPVHVRNGKYPMSGRVTQPGGLASEPPRKAVWRRMNDEFGALYLHPETKTIEVLVLKPDAETLAAYPDLMKTLEARKNSQERTIRKEAAKLNPDAANWNLKLTHVETQSVNVPGGEDHITIKGADQVQCGTLKGIVFDEPNRATLNINLVQSVKLPGLLKDLHLVDMEGYGRTNKLHSVEEIIELGDKATPALRNIGQRYQGLTATPKASQPSITAPSLG